MPILFPLPAKISTNNNKLVKMLIFIVDIPPFTRNTSSGAPVPVVSILVICLFRHSINQIRLSPLVCLRKKSSDY